jgi:hypothetical protein
MDNFEPPPDAEAGEHTVGDRTSDVGDSPDDDIRSNNSAGDSCERSGYQGVAQELELENGVD